MLGVSTCGGEFKSRARLSSPPAAAPQRIVATGQRSVAGWRYRRHGSRRFPEYEGSRKPIHPSFPMT